MGTRRGGDTVKGGYYWNLERWDATFVEGPAGELPGSPREIYRGIPTVALLFVAPMMGALFVMFLPFIGIALLLQHITRAAMAAAGETLERVLRSVWNARRTRLAVSAGRTRGQHSGEATPGKPRVPAAVPRDRRPDRH
jgi:hypothetical protein